MTTPPRASAQPSSSVAVAVAIAAGSGPSSRSSTAGSPPPTSRAQTRPDLPSPPVPPRRAASEATSTSTAVSPSRTQRFSRAPSHTSFSSSHAAHGRTAATPRSLRAQTLTRLAGSSSSTPRARLARGGPPRVSIRERARPPPDPPEPPAVVRYHWSTMVILVLYLPLLVIPWVIVCVLDVKPLTWRGSSYETSGWYTPNDIAWVPRWVRASNILACFSSALAYPVVTTVLSHASVAFVQNVRSGQRVSARDLLALADGCWTRLNGDRRTRLANVGSMLIVLGMIIPLLQISAVRVEQITIASCTNVPYTKNPDQACHKLKSFDYTVGGYDPEPADMAMAPGNLVAREVRNQLPTLTNLDSLSHIWPNIAGAGDNWALDLGNTFYYYQKTSIQAIPFYVSNFPQTFNTGVLREHALRFNSTVSCRIVDQSSFPEICPGESPLYGQFSSDQTQNRFCVPGNSTATPWTIDRDRQDILEELWVDNYIPYGSVVTNISGYEVPGMVNITVHCAAHTTRGYFELPNNHNDGKAGELLEYWPSQAVLEAEFNDVEAGSSSVPPAEENPYNSSEILVFRYGADPFDLYNQSTPGPLTVLINAMLGQESWFQPIANSTNIQETRDSFISACTRGLPFATYSGYLRNGFSTANLRCSLLDYSRLPPLDTNTTTTDAPTAQIAGAASRLVAEWFSGFAFNSSTEDALSAGLYLASEALLGITADSSKIDGARPVYVSGGTSTVKPTMRNPSKAIVSLLVFVQVVGLLALAWSSYRVPTFASRMDSLHVAALGAQLVRRSGVELPPLGLQRRGLARVKFLKKLEGVDGLIGLEEDGEGEGEEGEGREEIELMHLRPRRSSAVTHRTSATLTPFGTLGFTSYAPSSPHSSPLAQQLQSSRPASSPRSSVHGGGGGTPQRLSGSHASLMFAPRPPRVHSFASSSHTNDDVISALGAVSEMNGPDGPPKYEDVVQTGSERTTGTAGTQRRLVVGGPGRITRALAKASKPTARRRRGPAYNVRTAGGERSSEAANSSRSGDRSSRSSAIGLQSLLGSRTA